MNNSNFTLQDFVTELNWNNCLLKTKRTACSNLRVQPVLPLVDAQLVPEVTYMVPGSHLCMWTHRQVHDQPAAGVRITRPNGQTLLPAESRLLSPRGRIASVGERAPVAQHPIGQQLLWQRQREVGHRGRVEKEGQLGTVAGVLVAESQTWPDAVVWCHVVEHVHPHLAACCRAGTRWPPGRTQEDVVGDDLKREGRTRERWSNISELVCVIFTFKSVPYTEPVLFLSFYLCTSWTNVTHSTETPIIALHNTFPLLFLLQRHLFL